jgi:pyrimidine operon attenuation protein/uracil phosphoribosyltransferase
VSVTAPVNGAAVLLPSEAIGRALPRLAHQIREQNPDLSRVALVGIRTRGVPLAGRLKSVLERTCGVLIPFGEIDITPYRDDLSRPDLSQRADASRLDFGVEGLTVVLVDDVLFTGRTARAAIDALLDRGRPARVQLAVLVDRGHRELPIRPDYVGKNVPSALDEEVRVRLVETDGEDAVLMVKRQEGA